VVSDGSGVFTLTLTDATAGWNQTIQQSVPDAELGSAEIIAEAPSDGQQILPLSDFGTVNFTNVTINGQPLGAAGNLTSIAMGDSTATLATPSAITDNNAFTVTEDTAAGATPTSTPTPQPSTPTATIPTPDPTSPTTSNPTRHHHHHNGSTSSAYGVPWGS
jgi:hypothetical protein